MPVISRRFFPGLTVLLFGSGAAALIYEIVWFQLLELVIGSSAISLGILLATYMGGLCLGSLGLPRLISERPHPLRVYALIELGIGILGLLVLLEMPTVAGVYAAHVGHGLAGLVFRGAVSAICLLPPTILMGATLPAVSRWLEATPQGASLVGFLYGANTAGAVFGSLAAGFYLLRIYDMSKATYVAAGINACVAAAALIFAQMASHRPTFLPPPNEVSPPEQIPGSPHSWPAYLVIGLSGFCALGAEVVWTRLLSLMLGATVYTFSIILAVFLVGLAAGSGLGSALARRTHSPMALLGICQLLLAGGIAWTAFMLSRSLPYWPVDPTLSSSPWLSFQLDLVRCLWAVLPPTILWGASFPLALAAAAHRQDPGRLVGGIYASNTIGAIAGSLGFTLALIPLAGTRTAQRLLIGLAAAAGILAAAPSALPIKPKSESPALLRNPGLQKSRVAGVLSLAIASALSIWLVWSTPQVPWELIAYGRRLLTKVGKEKPLYIGEGTNASVAVTEDGNVRIFHVSGRAEASNVASDMRMERMLGHLPALLHPKPRTILVVGCGAGVTAGSFVLHPDVERIVLCEIEPLVPRVVARFFARENYDVLNDPRAKIVIDDARHYILTTKETFDIITSDPIHPWIKGSATLYTKEYFDLCRRHLNPGGIITQWVPLYQSDFPTVKSEIATFFEAFPNGTIWSNDLGGLGYDLVLLGRTEAGAIHVDELDQRLKRSDHSGVAKSLADVGWKSALELLETYAGRAPDLAAWLEGSQINRDRNLRLQYLAGMGINSGAGALIYSDLLAHYKYPEGLFVGSPENIQALRKALQVSQQNP